MFNLSKIFGVCGAIILIVFDIWAIINCFSLNGVELFNDIINNMLPCGLLLGALTLCISFNKSFVKPLKIINMIIFGITALLRLLTVILYILERALVTYLAPMTTELYLEFAEFAAYTLLSLAVVFLIIYLMKGKLKKTTHILGGISIIVLLISWIAKIYIYISAGFEAESGAFAILGEMFTAGLFWDILIIAGYTLVIAALTGAMDKKEVKA